MARTATDAQVIRAAWERWQVGLTVPITVPDHLPPLRVLLVLDNVAGHKTPAFVWWLFAHGVMPLDTPVGGSWLNMAESIPRVLNRRALDGPPPSHPGDIIARFASVAKDWKAAPTPFVGGGASGPPGGRGNENDGTPWADQGPSRDSRSDDCGMATGEASDPLASHRLAA